MSPSHRHADVDWSQPLAPWSRYGVTLVRLREEHLELVRAHRNDPEIRRFMVFRDHITDAMQRAWFASIDNGRNFYSLIYFEGEAVGLSHTKDVDLETMTGEGGMMIWSRAHQNGFVSYLAALAGTDWMFEEFGMRCLVGRVRKENRRALRYNRALGYVFDPPSEDSETVVGRLYPEAYERATAVIRKSLAAQYG